MARINVEVVALLDRRFVVLGRLIRKDRYAALGRMIAVWHTCQEEETYHLTAQELDDIHPDIHDFSSKVLQSQLGVTCAEGIYICGTQGRIEWLSKQRQKGREGGHLGGRPKKPTGDTPGGLDSKTPPAPAPAPAPAKEKRLKIPAEPDSKKRKLPSEGKAFFDFAWEYWKKAKGKPPSDWPVKGEDFFKLINAFATLKKNTSDLEAKWAGYLAYFWEYDRQFRSHNPFDFGKWLDGPYSTPGALDKIPAVQAAVTAYIAEHNPPPYHTPEEVKEYMDRNPDLHWDNDMEFNGFWRYWVAKMKHYGHIKSTAPDGHGQYVGATPVMQARWDLATEWWENKVGKLGDTL